MSSLAFSRLYAVRASPPPNAGTPFMTVFAGPSRPRPYHANHPVPKRKRRLPTRMSSLGLIGCGLFLHHQSKENLFFRNQIDHARREERRGIEPEWWLNGDPRIKGMISTMQGNVDVSFRIKGIKCAFFFCTGTLYFTSIRREKGLPFTILRFKLIADDGQVVEIESKGL
ncbi:hypothetical protein K435DRAFT_758930 [Dendrothele bispora CBS 962.96]|uniref:DUF1783-domain-containing protein n=1 Tax=Dendrothele bispora (strain CBS 962.96) TaxID=1314807 RepID=A0A4S8LQN5_DENBC|nr:hypothetical protein K435DRAFT_758930 [Dendrothele bispora CBS 962.96]